MVKENFIMLDIRFIIDSKTYISMTCNEPLNTITMGTPGEIQLWHNNRIIYTLQKDGCCNALWCDLLAAHDSLTAALNGELEPLSTWPSVGYMLNEYYYHLRWPDDNPNNKVRKCAMWSPGLLPSTLLYNRNGEIVLQVVPIFRWFINKIPYEVFIRNYRSYFTCMISREMAQEWLTKITEIGQAMLDNYYGDKRPYGVKPIFPDKYLEES